MAARVIVWAVRLGTTDLEGQKGHLQLDTDGLSFVPEKAGNDITIPLSDVRRVRRPPGSPVLVIERTDSAVAFYFVEPPPLRFRSETSRKAKGRMKSISYLRGRNRTKRAEVKRWQAMIREAAGPGVR